LAIASTLACQSGTNSGLPSLPSRKTAYCTREGGNARASATPGSVAVAAAAPVCPRAVLLSWLGLTVR
jgi:hypothetical protein